MNASSIRAFGIALFLIGAMLSLAQRFDFNIGLATNTASSDKEVVALQKKLEVANKEIALLKEQLSEKATTEPKSVDENKNDSTSNDNELTNKSGDAKTMTLQVYNGITPYVVAQKLEEGDIISNSVEMELLLANPKYSRSLQIGSYEVNSSMTNEEIANLITGKR